MKLLFGNSQVEVAHRNINNKLGKDLGSSEAALPILNVAARPVDGWMDGWMKSCSTVGF